jgi:hypothetical protein
MNAREKAAGLCLNIIQHPDLATKWEDIGPEVAADYLKSNIDNRRIRRAAVARFAADMRAGRWRQTHQGISFGGDGRILDGQHRLMAIVAAGVTVRMLVTRGQDPDNFTVIDHGKVRNTADAFGIRFALADPRAAAATTRAVICRARHSNGVPQAQIDDDAVCDFYEKHRDVIDAMIAAFGKRFSSAIVGCAVACVLDGYASAPRLAECGLRLRERDWRGKGDPLFLLREIVRSQPEMPGPTRYRYAVTAFAADLRGRRLSLLRPSTKDWLDGPGSSGAH